MSLEELPTGRENCPIPAVSVSDSQSNYLKVGREAVFAVHRAQTPDLTAAFFIVQLFALFRRRVQKPHHSQAMGTERKLEIDPECGYEFMFHFRLF